jgi:hypothetical protein
MPSQTLPLHRKHFPEVNKPPLCNSEHEKVISDTILKGKPCDFAQILRKFSDFAQKSVIFGFAWVGYPLATPTSVDILLK